MCKKQNFEKCENVKYLLFSDSGKKRGFGIDFAYLTT